MDAESVTAFLRTQVSAVASAPLPFLAAVAVAAFTMWKIFEYRYGAEVANLREDVKSRDRKLAEAQSRIAELSVAKDAPAKALSMEAVRSADSSKSDAQQLSTRRRRAIDAMDRAILEASIIRRDFKREREKALPIIRAAALSVSRAYEIEIVARVDDVAIEIELNKRYWERVKPFLVEGHLIEAREAAAELISKTPVLRATIEAARINDLLS